jgi:hypothetical protein
MDGEAGKMGEKMNEEGACVHHYFVTVIMTVFDPITGVAPPATFMMNFMAVQPIFISAYTPLSICLVHGSWVPQSWLPETAQVLLNEKMMAATSGAVFG